MDLDSNLKEWKSVTGDLNWGTQRVFLTTLQTVMDGDVHLVHGANYRDGKPCLVNAVATMISRTSVTPTEICRTLVQLFDSINRELVTAGVNKDDGYVSSLAAEILIRNFGELKPEPDLTPKVPSVMDAPYAEASDAALAADFLRAMSAPAPEVVSELAEQGDPIAQHILGLQ